MHTRKRWIVGGVIALLLLLVFIGRPQPDTDANGEFAQGADYIAVIRVDGPIVGGSEISGILGSGTVATSEQLMKDVRRATFDPHAKAVLLRINSPGGSATATQEIGDELDRLRAEGKPIVVSMGDSCASGGYWLAAKGDYIFANPSTMTGSIGVYIGYTNYEELMNKLGIRNDKIKSGAHKDILSPDRPMTDEERALVQRMVDDIYEQFVDVVADGRKMDRNAVKAIADGRIMTGRQAQDAGLVDALGNYYAALAYTAEKVGLDTVRPPIKEYGKDASWNRLFSLSLSRDIARGVRSALTDVLADAARTDAEVPYAR